MALALGVTYQEILIAVHTLTGTFISGSDNTYTTSLSGEGSTTYTSSTSVPVTKIASGTATMSGGAATIDLTALTGLAGEAITFLGLKVQFAFFRAPSTNANVLAVSQGASDAYGLDAAGGTWLVRLDPDSSVLRRIANSAEDVASDAKTIDIAGTGSQTLEYILIAG